MITIDRALPAGNIQLLSVNGNTIHLANELRDTSTDWFYWKFRAVFPSTGAYTFCFGDKPRIGTRGVAISLDKGETWSWGGNRISRGSFSYDCHNAGDEIWFCQGIPYLQHELDRFLALSRCNESLRVTPLCQSTNKRNVELLSVEEGRAQSFCILLTARHHACEALANYVLEGFCKCILADTDFGKSFRNAIKVYAVPFIDKDGVEDGDQGKSRRPHDHARDYNEESIYPEIRALRCLIDRVRPVTVLDLHCPGLYGDCNETLFFPCQKEGRFARTLDQLSVYLEKYCPPELCYSRDNNIPFGVSWNTDKNYTQGKSLAQYCAGLSFVEYAQTFEVPYANAGDCTMTVPLALAVGGAMARSLFDMLYKK